MTNDNQTSNNKNNNTLMSDEQSMRVLLRFF